VSGDEFLAKIVDSMKVDGTVINIYDFINLVKATPGYSDIAIETMLGSGSWKGYSKVVEGVKKSDGQAGADAPKEKKKKKNNKTKGDQPEVNRDKAMVSQQPKPAEKKVVVEVSAQAKGTENFTKAKNYNLVDLREEGKGAKGGKGKGLGADTNVFGVLDQGREQSVSFILVLTIHRCLTTAPMKLRLSNP
jgi:hypothetical protein